MTLQQYEKPRCSTSHLGPKPSQSLQKKLQLPRFCLYRYANVVWFMILAKIFNWAIFKIQQFVKDLPKQGLPELIGKQLVCGSDAEITGVSSASTSLVFDMQLRIDNQGLKVKTLGNSTYSSIFNLANCLEINRCFRFARI